MGAAVRQTKDNGRRRMLVSNRSKWKVVKVMAAAIGDYKRLLNLTFFFKH